MPSKVRFDRHGFALRILTVVIGCAGLAWGTTQLTRNTTTDEFLDIEAHLLRFEKFSPAVTTELLERASVIDLNACDTHGQRTLLLLEMPLAETALRSGDVQSFDRHVGSIESRSKKALACAPRDSLIWLIMFGLEVLHGGLDQHSFDLLSMSYTTSPNEAWVSLRRIIVAIPVITSAPEPIREKLLTEFASLIRHGFVDVPASVYLKSSPAVRTLLQSQVDKLNTYNQKAFSEALQKLRA